MCGTRSCSGWWATRSSCCTPTTARTSLASLWTREGMPRRRAHRPLPWLSFPSPAAASRQVGNPKYCSLNPAVAVARGGCLAAVLATGMLTFQVHPVLGEAVCCLVFALLPQRSARPLLAPVADPGGAQGVHNMHASLLQRHRHGYAGQHPLLKASPGRLLREQSSV